MNTDININWDELVEKSEETAKAKAAAMPARIANRDGRDLQWTGKVEYTTKVESVPNLRTQALDDEAAKVIWNAQFIETYKTKTGRVRTTTVWYFCHEIVERIEIGKYTNAWR